MSQTLSDLRLSESVELVDLARPFGTGAVNGGYLPGDRPNPVVDGKARLRLRLAA